MDEIHEDEIHENEKNTCFSCRGGSNILILGDKKVCMLCSTMILITHPNTLFINPKIPQKEVLIQQ